MPVGSRLDADEFYLDVTAKDLKSIALRFRRLSVTMRKNAKARVRRFLLAVQRETSATAPYDTGYMSEHVEVRLQSDGLAGETGWYKNTFLQDAEQTKGRFYAPYQEYGSRRNRAQPSLGPAFEKYAPEFREDISRMIKAAIANERRRKDG